MMQYIIVTLAIFAVCFCLPGRLPKKQTRTRRGKKLKTPPISKTMQSFAIGEFAIRDADLVEMMKD